MQVNKKISKMILSIALVASMAAAQESKFTIGGYGEILYSHFDYGPDQKSGLNGSPSDSRAIMDIPRFILEFEYSFSKSLSLETEIEYEHGGTGGAVELEFEEFGEFETEVEKGGEITIEEFHITKTFSSAFNLRLGHFILPIGLINKAHDPKDFFTTSRPEAEVSLIPTTWHETGVEVFGMVRDFSYRLQIVNGLDATGFSSRNWIVEGYQSRFEQVKATDMALVGRFDYNGVDGLMIGVSGYRGNSTNNRPKPDLENVDGHVTIGDVHANFQRGPWIARALYLYGTLQNADLISQRNRNLSRFLPVPKTPVASAAKAWTAELGYNVFSLFSNRDEYRLYPFIRYEYYNSMEKVDRGIFADPRFERKIFTAGAIFFLTPGVVLKADYSHRTLGESRFNDENTFSISLGFSGDFFEYKP